MHDEIYGQVAATAQLEPHDPRAGEKLTALMDQALAVGLGKHWGKGEYTMSLRAASQMMLQTFTGWRTLAMSVLGAAYGYLGAKPGEVRVVATDGPAGMDFEFWAKPQDAEDILVGRVRYQPPEQPTATSGLTIGLTLHLTPAASRPYWDFGDVVAADAKDNGPLDEDADTVRVRPDEEDLS